MIFKRPEDILRVEEEKGGSLWSYMVSWKQGKMKHGESRKVIDG